MRNGDFRRIMSAGCRGGTARTLGAPFVNNQINPALYHPISVTAHEHGAGGRSGAWIRTVAAAIVLRLANDSTDQQYVSRADYQMTHEQAGLRARFLAH